MSFPKAENNKNKSAEDAAWQRMYKMGEKTARRFNIRNEEDIERISTGVLLKLKRSQSEVRNGKGKILRSLKDLR